MLVVRRFPIADPLARAHVAAALAGPGGPMTVRDVAVEGEAVVVTADDAGLALLDDLVAIEGAFVPAAVPPFTDRATAAAVAARGLGDPELDASRILETYVEAHP